MTAVERAEWLEWRRKGIGASDVAAIVGISLWSSAWSVWAEKVGLLEVDDESEAMEFGRWAELMVAPWFEERSGLFVAGAQTQVEHPDHEWRRCTVDGFVFDHEPAANFAALREVGLTPEPLGLCQIKTTGPGRRWDELPAHIQAQEQWEMHVTGLDHVWLPVLHGRRLEVYELDRDDADVDLIVERVDRFYCGHVLTGVPPELDGHDATLRALASIYPTHTPGEAVSIDHVRGALTMLADAKRARKAAEEEEAAAGALIRWALKSAEEGTVDGQRAVTLRAQTRTTKCPHCKHEETSDPFRVLRPAKGFT
ncbi:MAG: YqaJ viral recombinase family protein [Actinobacteria bacterium]|nr:YqaJ viral recombinase family protein [Actinomycetota bacterium]